MSYTLLAVVPRNGLEHSHQKTRLCVYVNWFTCNLEVKFCCHSWHQSVSTIIYFWDWEMLNILDKYTYGARFRFCPTRLPIETARSVFFWVNFPKQKWLFLSASHPCWVFNASTRLFVPYLLSRHVKYDLNSQNFSPF